MYCSIEKVKLMNGCGSRCFKFVSMRSMVKRTESGSISVPSMVHNQFQGVLRKVLLPTQLGI